MPMSSIASGDQAMIDAAAWVARLDAPDVSDDDALAFDAWLAAERLGRLRPERQTRPGVRLNPGLRRRTASSRALAFPSWQL